jgi:hypothetical protein
MKRSGWPQGIMDRRVKPGHDKPFLPADHR